MPVRVSVVTATYNGAGLLRQSLASLVAQTYTSFDAWIVGDASTDDSDAVVRGFDDRRLHWINLPRNSGSQASPNNEGIRRSQGELIAYLGHDDLWFPWHLDALVHCLDAAEADFAHSLLVTFDPMGACGASGPPPSGLTYRDHFVPPSAWLHRRSALEAWGPWASPDALGHAVDFDFSRRAALAGARFAFAPRLSVLKFPSAFFQTYAKPLADQARYGSMMARDPAGLEHQILQQLALVMASHPQQYLGRVASDTALLKRAVAVVARRRVVDRWRHTWPLSAVLRVYFQRKRARLRSRRGLRPRTQGARDQAGKD